MYLSSESKRSSRPGRCLSHVAGLQRRWGFGSHITLAAVVALLAVVVGARAWGLYHGSWPVQRMGQVLIGLVSVQVTLGIAALAVTQGKAIVGSPTTVEVTIATAHQATGAALLALSVALLLWTGRLFRQADVETLER